MEGGARYGASRELAMDACRRDAWVRSELGSPARRNYQFINGRYPLFGARAKGAYLWDVDDNRYIDYVLGYGTVLLGHADSRVVDAVKAELELGHCLSPLWKPQQAELAELICSLVPNAEMAFFMKTGSDATAGAVRLARVFTGRDVVLRWGYNGWHDWCTPRPSGVPPCTREVVHEFPYNNVAAVESLLDQHRDKVACILMMPFDVVAPEPGFLESLRTLAHSHGALFIFDEMRSGFRFAMGGAQEFLGIDADLVTFSKGMANGFAISCIAGREDVLRGLSSTKMTATYFASSDGMAAALACIRAIEEDDVPRRVWRLGERLLEGLTDAASRSGFQDAVLGYPPCPYVTFDFLSTESASRAKIAFFSEAARAGVFLHPSHHWYISGAHTERDIEETIAVCRDAFKVAEEVA